jgi:hypothetical protein
MMGLELAGEAEILRENPPMCHIVHHKSHMTWDRIRVAPLGKKKLFLSSTKDNSSAQQGAL